MHPQDFHLLTSSSISKANRAYFFFPFGSKPRDGRPPSPPALLDSVHELDVLLQLPAHHGQQLLILLLELHLRHAAIKELGDKHAGSGRTREEEAEAARSEQREEAFREREAR